jgi:hypothetical protein
MSQPPFAAESSPAGFAGGRRISLPAGLMSMLLHLLLVLAAASIVRPQILRPQEEPDRQVSIVLASRSGRAATEYFAASDQSATSNPPANSEQQDAASQSARDGGDPLPAAAVAESMLADADLPTHTAGVPGVDGDALQLPPLTDSGRPRILPGLGDDEILQDDPLRNRPPGPSGPTAKMTLFGHVAEGRSFVFVIDRSRSMGGQGLGVIAAAERELVRELANLEPIHRFQIIAYNQSFTMLNRKGMLEASGTNKQLAARFLSGIVAAGGTEHEPPLAVALRFRPEVILLLTDGEDPPLSSPEIDLLTRESAGHTAIHCLHFGSGPLQQEDNFLRRLARLNGGNYSYVDTAAP